MIKISSKNKEFIENNKDLLNSYNFDAFFGKARLDLPLVPDYMHLCQIVYKKIPNLLSYMSYVPSYLCA